MLQIYFTLIIYFYDLDNLNFYNKKWIFLFLVSPVKYTLK